MTAGLGSALVNATIILVSGYVILGYVYRWARYCVKTNELNRDLANTICRLGAILTAVFAYGVLNSFAIYGLLINVTAISGSVYVFCSRFWGVFEPFIAD